jgi:hypothetical protein
MSEIGAPVNGSDGDYRLGDELVTSCSHDPALTLSICPECGNSDVCTSACMTGKGGESYSWHVDHKDTACLGKLRDLATTVQRRYQRRTKNYRKEYQHGVSAYKKKGNRTRGRKVSRQVLFDQRGIIEHGARDYEPDTMVCLMYDPANPSLF